MKTLKNIALAALFVVGGTAFAQDKSPKPEFKKQGELIKGTYYYDDGSVKQEGTYKDGKLHGEWVSFDQNGEKVAIGQYNQGEKNGKWFFWSGDKLTEVDYTENQIANVSNYKNENSVVSNE